MDNKFSEKEVALFKTLGFENLLHSEPYVLYQMAALYVFMENKTGNSVESVRRCLRAMQNGSPYRLTKEFDDLIEND